MAYRITQDPILSVAAAAAVLCVEIKTIATQSPSSVQLAGAADGAFRTRLKKERFLPVGSAEAAGAAEAQAPAQTAETGGETASAESFIDEEGRTRPVTLGQVIDLLNGSTFIRDHRDYPFTFKATVGDLMEIVGTEKVKEVVEKTTAEASYNKDYAKTEENIIGYWFMLGLFILFFACISVLALEMIDRDKR